jgi:16S rRNA (cytidine1402-2'-O)-methyltransferase
MKPGLYLVGTPIGNLGDVTVRALEVLQQADVILTEDTRRTGILLRRYEIRTPMISCHKFNEASRTHIVVERIRGGSVVALVVDSGMPGVSDPGGRTVTACREKGLYVTVIPGPSAVATAVAVSGFGERGFWVEGFLDHRAPARRRRLAELAARGVALVLFESPYRLTALVEDIESVFGERPVFVGREMTKAFEELRWGTPSEIRAAFRGRRVRGEIVVVVSGR